MNQLNHNNIETIEISKNNNKTYIKNREEAEMNIVYWLNKPKINSTLSIN